MSMSMRTLGTILSLFVATFAVADVDLAYTIVSQKPAPVSGEPVNFDIRVTNSGPDPATNVSVMVTQSTGGSALLGFTAPVGWQCDFTRYSSGTTCTIASLPSGAEVFFAATFVMPIQPGQTSSFGGVVRTASRDVNPHNNVASVALSVAPGPFNSDLRILTAPSLQVTESSEVRHELSVQNLGPSQARGEVATIINLLGPGAASVGSLSASGAGWTCETVAPTRVVCTRNILNSGATAPIEVRFTAPAFPTTLSLSANILAELSRDANGASASMPIFVGTPQSWRMMLVPLINSGIRGANNSLWNTDLTMFIRSGPAEVQPDNCTFSPIPECQRVPPPAGTPFDPRSAGIVGPNPSALGQFIYVRAEHFDNVQLNARIYDQSRQQQTAGAEIPIPRDDAFRAGLMMMLNIPVAPEYRHTLRIYDAGGRDGTRVAVRVYANNEAAPRASTIHTLALPAETTFVTTARLPAHPASVQLELGQLTALTGLETVRVEVEPLDEGVRLWSFVSITNNLTHHVTTVTPQ